MIRSGPIGPVAETSPRPDRIRIIGVLNVTPDSFSDGGRWADADAAVAHGLHMWADGADIVDVGGESTRPGAAPVAADQEAGRVVPVITELARAGVTVSVDTYRAGVAAAALDAGARIVNDVSGGLGDPEMAAVVRSAGCPWILMHWRGPSARMNARAVYDDVVTDVVAELRSRVQAAVAAGVDADRLVIDPGLGFAKTAAHNWAILGALDRFIGLGPPVLIGASRKSFLGALLGVDGVARPAAGREAATTAITTYAALAGAWAVRVHDVRANVDAALAAAAIRAATPAGPAAAGREPARSSSPR